MSKIPVYGHYIKYNQDFDMLSKAIRLFVLAKELEEPDSSIRKRLFEVLSLYCAYDYSQKTKNLVKSSLGISTANLNVINSELTRKGYLQRGRYNHTRKHIDPKLLELINYFKSKESKDKIFLFKFMQSE